MKHQHASGSTRDDDDVPAHLRAQEAAADELVSHDDDEEELPASPAAFDRGIASHRPLSSRLCSPDLGEIDPSTRADLQSLSE